jgi:hypothetical protein
VKDGQAHVLAGRHAVLAGGTLDQLLGLSRQTDDQGPSHDVRGCLTVATVNRAIGKGTMDLPIGVQVSAAVV